jgi:hypothetical protein
MTELEKVTAQRDELREILESYVDAHASAYEAAGADPYGSPGNIHTRTNLWIVLYRRATEALRKIGNYIVNSLK